MATTRTVHKGALLLVGTQADTRKVTQILLEKEGYRVEAFKSPDEAVAFIEQNEDVQVRLCITDLLKQKSLEPLYDTLAGGRHGRKPGFDSKAETMVEGQIEDRSIPILFLAQSDEDGRKALKESGLLGEYLVKPYDKSDLLAKVRQFASR